MRAVERLQFIESINNYDVHVFGAAEEHANWKALFPDKKNLVLHDEIAYDKLPELFLQSRCVLNSEPMIKNGAHERLLLALCQGASVITSDNVFISSHFPESKAVMGVLEPDFAHLDELLKKCFEDEDARIKDVMATHDVIRSDFTWDVRAEMLLKQLPKMIEELKQNVR